MAEESTMREESILGGSSARKKILLPFYQRPTVGSLKMWADAVGDEGYTWEELLKYFKVGSNDSSTGVFACRFCRRVCNSLLRIKDEER